MYVYVWYLMFYKILLNVSGPSSLQSVATKIVDRQCAVKKHNCKNFQQCIARIKFLLYSQRKRLSNKIRNVFIFQKFVGLQNQKVYSTFRFSVRMQYFTLNQTVDGFFPGAMRNIIIHIRFSMVQVYRPAYIYTLNWENMLYLHLNRWVFLIIVFSQEKL